MKLFSKEEYINKSIVTLFGLKFTIKRDLTKIVAENRNFYLQNWKDFPLDYVEQYKRLVTGLDDESCRVVANILKRMRKLKKKSFKSKFKFTPAEKVVYSKIKEDLDNQITYLGKWVWAYKDYLLQEGFFEPGVFYYDCYTKCLDDKSCFFDKDIIDAGAYIGDSSLVLSKLTSKKVYAFEPVKQTYECLKKTLVLNETTNVIPVNLGLGDVNTQLPITEQKSLGASFLNKTPSDVQVSVTTLDEYVEENNINVGLIKVDIEGFEQNFLKGAYKTIQKYRPTLLVSIYHNTSDFFEIKPLIESWNLGYKFKIRKAVDNDVVRDTMLICEPI